MFENPIAKKIRLIDLLSLLGLEVSEFRLFLQLRSLHHISPKEVEQSANEVKKYLDYEVIHMDREFNITIRTDKMI